MMRAHHHAHGSSCPDGAPTAHAGGPVYTWEEAQYGAGAVALKIVDVLDEEWFGVVEG